MAAWCFPCVGFTVTYFLIPLLVQWIFLYINLYFIFSLVHKTEVTWSLRLLMHGAFWRPNKKKMCHISLIISEQFYSSITWHSNSRVTYGRKMMCSESICLESYRENLVPRRLVDSSSPSESISSQHLGFSEIP